MPSEPYIGAAPFTTGIAATPRARREPRVDPRAPVRRAPRRDRIFLAGVALLALLAIATARSGLFTAGSEAGYWIGVAGGVAMLLLFLYPLRKRWRPLRDLGAARFWFALHMLLGIAGPLLIVVHSTLRFGSVNATVAFATMAVVAVSGLVGRFLYGRIHHGLYGRRATLAELRADAGLDSEEIHSKLAFVPAVEARLREFAEIAAATGAEGLRHPLQFAALGLKAAAARRLCIAEASGVLRARAVLEGWSSEQLARRIRNRSALITTHLRAVQRIAQFGVFERLFSLWHVLHVPLVYMMVLSAIAHVVAVHMY